MLGKDRGARIPTEHLVSSSSLRLVVGIKMNFEISLRESIYTVILLNAEGKGKEKSEREIGTTQILRSFVFSSSTGSLVSIGSYPLNTGNRSQKTTGLGIIP